MQSAKTSDEVVRALNPVEARWYEQQLRSKLKAGYSPEAAKEKSLEVIVNTVEGDETQLSDSLREFAIEKGWLDDWREQETIAKLGKGIVKSLSCDANGTGAPCRTDGLEAVKLMKEYLKIYGYEVKEIASNQSPEAKGESDGD